MKLKIVKDSNPIMRKKSLPVEMPLSDEDKELLLSMLDYLKKSQDDDYAKKHNIRAGVGMAAIQVGVLKRMFVIYYPKGEDEIVEYALVNPQIIEESIKKCALEQGEGCLSVNREVEGHVKRYARVSVEGFDMDGNKISVRAREELSIAFQHEIDHLDGILFYDRIDKNHKFYTEDELRLI